MSLSRRQERLLRGIGEAVSRSDPRLAGTLAVFARLTAGEAMPGREQLHTAGSQIRDALILAAAAAARLICWATTRCARALCLAWAAAVAGWSRLARYRPLAGQPPPSRSPRASTSTSTDPGGTR
jgi:hypothetical protein